MTQPMYEIRVAGVVPEEDLQDMGAVTAAPHQVSTILYGVPNQAALVLPAREAARIGRRGDRAPSRLGLHWPSRRARRTRPARATKWH